MTNWSFDGSWSSWALGILALSAVAAIGFVLTTYLFAVLVTRGAFGWPGLSYFGRETLWVIITQAMLPFGWHGDRRPRSGTSGASARRPIVLIHGYTQNRTNFYFLSRTLERRGHGPFFGFNYGTFQPIEKSARELGAFVERLLEETGATEVDFICHSLGGVVARTYVDLLGGDRVVRRVITLGSPHRGIRQAFPIFGAAIADLDPRRGFIPRLEAAASRVVVHSIYSEHDNIVFPVAASTLAPRGTDFVVRRHGHFGILFAAEVTEYVHRTLSEPVAVAAGERVIETVAEA